MYDFIRLQYQMRKLTEAQVKALSPRWITTEQAEKIVDLSC